MYFLMFKKFQFKSSVTNFFLIEWKLKKKLRIVTKFHRFSFNLTKSNNKMFELIFFETLGSTLPIFKYIRVRIENS